MNFGRCLPFPAVGGDTDEESAVIFQGEIYCIVIGVVRSSEDVFRQLRPSSALNLLAVVNSLLCKKALSVLPDAQRLLVLLTQNHTRQDCDYNHHKAKDKRTHEPIGNGSRHYQGSQSYSDGS